jgi:K+-sensing histidine kinase KdpD
VILLIVSVLFIDQTNTDNNPDVPVLSKNWVVSYYAALNIVLFISVLPLLGIIKGSEYTFTGMVFYAFCSSLLMTALMQFRINKLRNIHSEYENRLLLSEHRIILEKNKREEQTHLFHMLMHEIKNPLAVIDMALLANNDQRTTSAYVSRAVNSVKDILDRCFKANRLSDGNIDVKLTKIFLADFFDQLFLSKNWQRNAFQLDVTELLIVTADLQLLGIVLSNLLDNALRYGDPQMPVDVAAKIKSNKSGIAGVSIVVSNRPGIASWPDPDKVFKKYYRSAGAEAQSGTGLGLYLIRTLANLMHGDCNYVPDDKNIRFELWLPT